MRRGLPCYLLLRLCAGAVLAGAVLVHHQVIERCDALRHHPAHAKVPNMPNRVHPAVHGRANTWKAVDSRA